VTVAHIRGNLETVGDSSASWSTPSSRTAASSPAASRGRPGAPRSPSRPTAPPWPSPRAPRSSSASPPTCGCPHGRLSAPKLSARTSSTRNWRCRRL